MMKHIVIEKGAKTNKLLRIYYQDATTDKYYEWDANIIDMKTMKAVEGVCENLVHTGTYGQRAFYETTVDENKIAEAIAQLKNPKIIKFK